jgi:hypothetical protein
MSKEISKKASKKYRASKTEKGFVAINKYVPAEMRGPLHKFIDSQVDLYEKGGLSATSLAPQSTP